LPSFRVEKIGLTRFVVIDSNRGPILVDTVPLAYRERFWRRLDRLGLAPSRIAALILTHHHSDHTGMAASLLEINPMIRLIFHANEEQALSSGRNQPTVYTNQKVENFSKKANLQPTFPPLKRRPHDIVFEEAQSPILRDWGVEAALLHTPGHTSGSVCLFFDEGTLIAGDTFSNIPLNPFKTNPFPFVYEDMPALLRSWKWLLSKEPVTITPSHGRSLSVSKVEKALKNQETQSNLSQ